MRRCGAVRRGVMLVLVVLLVWGGLRPAPTIQAQGDDLFKRALYNAQQWTLRTLGKPNLILVEYTYEATSWPDSSMGCPQQGEPVTPGEVNGYRWTFLFDNNVRYEVHTNLEGTQGVLCSSLNTSSDVRLAAYTTSTFTIPVPEAWLVYPDEDGVGVLFAPQQQPTCSDPGMVVTVLGRVASGVTPDQLLDAYLAEAGASDTPTERSTVGTFGKSTVFETPCDSSTRKWRLSAFVQYGSAYQVEQWAPLNQWEQWSDLFLEMLNQFGPSDASLVPPTSPESAGGSPEGDPSEGGEAAAPTAPTLPALPMAHLFVGDVFLTTLNDIPGRSITSIPSIERRYLSFSPDGLLLVFEDVTNRQVRVLNVAEGRSPRMLAEEIDPRFPPAWSADSRELAYVVDSGTVDADGVPLLEIRAVPAGGGEPRILGRFAFGGDCPVSLSDPADAPYFQEVGPGGRDPVLVWLTEDRVLLSTACEGGLGVLTLDDSKVTELGADLLGGVLSPDRQRFLAQTPSGLAVLDFQVWERTDLNVGQDARQLAWAADGQTVFYSTETRADSTTLDSAADEERGTAIFGFWPVTVTINDLSLVRVDVATSQETVLWQGQGRGIGRIAPAPDGSGLLFSVIPSSLPVIEVFQAGADPLAVREAWPVPGLYWLGSADSTPRLLAYSGQPAFAPVTINAG